MISSELDPTELNACGPQGVVSAVRNHLACNGGKASEETKKKATC